MFTCEAPYPIDAYVRCSLRRRGWVEKFGDRAPRDGAPGHPRGGGSNAKLECEDDDGETDFLSIRCNKTARPSKPGDPGV